MNNLWKTIKPFFEQSWWQGFAGIAQFIAAILTIISVRQAKKMFDLAKKERMESVEPSWDIINESIVTKFSSPENFYSLEGQITFLNSGYGPARNFEIEFKSSNGNVPTKVIKNNNNVIFPKDKVNIRFNWNIKEPPEGVLFLKSVTRLGYKTINKLNIKTFIEINHLNFGNWNQIWVIDKKGKSMFKIAYSKFKNIFTGNDENNNRENLIKKIRKYYQMERWIKENFVVQEDLESRGSIILERKEKVSENGGKIVTSTGVSVHKIVTMFGLLDIPPTAAEMQNAISEKENKFIWNKRIKEWLDKGIISKGKGYKEIDLDSPKPEEYKNAVKYALGKMHYKDLDSINHHKLVDNVRDYFNKNDINYDTFSFNDVSPYIKKIIEN